MSVATCLVAILVAGVALVDKHREQLRGVAWMSGRPGTETSLPRRSNRDGAAATAETNSNNRRSESAVHKHLEMIQGVISRMGQNAFATKAWSVSLMAAVLAFGSAPRLSQWLVLVPAVAFWGLDVYYLRRERLFRRLYTAAVAGEAPLYSMDVEPFQTEVGRASGIAFTPSVILIHGITAVAIGLRAADAQGWLHCVR